MNHTNRSETLLPSQVVDFTRWCMVFAIVAASIACSHNGSKEKAFISQVRMSPSPSAEIHASPSPLLDSSIRAIDFTNFTYPAMPIYSKGEKTFTLKNGKYVGRLQDGAIEPAPVSFIQAAYGDITGDGVEEAIVVLFENVRGTAIPYFVYLYTLERGSPKLLWAFATGDRGDGGLRQVYAENGGLVIELYGKDTIIGGNLADTEEIGACCPKSFTRARYEWRENRFQQTVPPEVLPNPLSNAELLAPH